MTTIALGASGIVLGQVDPFGVFWSLQAGSDPWSPRPRPRDQSGPRATRHGSWNATEFYDARYWSATVLVDAPSHEALHDADQRLAAAVALAPFRRVVDEPKFGERWSLMRRDGDLLWTEDTPTTARASLSLRGDDPRIRALVAKTATTGFPASSGGLVWPATWPATWDATVTAGTMLLTNAGDAPASVLWRIDGPVTDPFITDLSTGRQLRTSLVLAEGEWVTIDTDTHRVLANGDENATRRDQVYGDWFDLAPGSRQVFFNGTAAGPGAQLTATWMDTWL